MPKLYHKAPWTRSPQALVLLASCALAPPLRRLVRYRFDEIGEHFAGARARALRQLYRAAEPPLDTPQWRLWLSPDADQAIAEAVALARAT